MDEDVCIDRGARLDGTVLSAQNGGAHRASASRGPATRISRTWVGSKAGASAPRKRPRRVWDRAPLYYREDNGMDFGLNGKRALITGSTAGIGFAGPRAIGAE